MYSSRLPGATPLKKYDKCQGQRLLAAINKGRPRVIGPLVTQWNIAL